MSSVANHYTKSLHKEFNYFGTWFPNNNLSLGDIGVFDKDQFIFRSNLKNLDVEFETKEDPSFGDMEYSTSGGVKVETKLSGKTPPAMSKLAQADAGLVVSFNKKDAILFKANGTQTLKIADQLSLATTIEKLFKEGKWKKEWVIITELIKAKSTSVLISSEKGAQVDLKAKGEITAGTIDIANAEAGLNVEFLKNMSTRFVAEENMTPLFKAMVIKKAWFGLGKGSLESKSGDGGEKEEREGLAEFSLEDL